MAPKAHHRLAGLSAALPPAEAERENDAATLEIFGIMDCRCPLSKSPFSTAEHSIAYLADCRASLISNMTSDKLNQIVAESQKPVHDSNGGPQALEDSDQDDNGVTEIESLCMNCHDDVSECRL